MHMQWFESISFPPSQKKTNCVNATAVGVSLLKSTDWLRRKGCLSALASPEFLRISSDPANRVCKFISMDLKICLSLLKLFSILQAQARWRCHLDCWWSGCPVNAQLSDRNPTRLYLSRYIHIYIYILKLINLVRIATEWIFDCTLNDDNLKNYLV